MKVRPGRRSDLEAVAALIRAADEAHGAPPDMAPEDVAGFWREIDPTQGGLLVEDESGLVGYVDVAPSSTDVHIDAYVHPSARGSDVGRRLIEGAEEIARRQVDDKLPRRATIVHEDDEGRQVLEAAGYAYARSFYRMRIVLDERPPEPEWPDGIAVRGDVPGDDDRLMHETLIEAFADSWEPRGHTLDEFVRFMAQDEQAVPAASFLAFAGDVPAGALFAKERFGTGWIQSVGVRRPC